MNRILQIAQLGNPILYQRAKEINDIEIESDFISDMKITVADANGVGLAAPQVYEPKRIFIIASILVESPESEPVPYLALTFDSNSLVLGRKGI